MKRITYYIFAISFLVLNKVSAQVSTATNSGSTGDYVGWDGSNNFPLQFRHENNSANSRFEWYTNIGGTTAERMRLTQTGELGLGTNAPASFLHLNTTATGELFRTDGAAANTNRWRLYTGSIEKFQLRIPGNSNNVILQSSNASPIVSGSQGGPGHLFFGTAGVLRLKINGTFDVAGTSRDLKKNSPTN